LKLVKNAAFSFMTDDGWHMTGARSRHWSSVIRQKKNEQGFNDRWRL